MILQYLLGLQVIKNLKNKCRIITIFDANMREKYMKKKEIKEVVPEVERLRKVSTFKLSCKESSAYHEDYFYGRYIFAETKEDAIKMLKNVMNFKRSDDRYMLKTLPEIVSENSSLLKITNTYYESLMDGTLLWGNDALKESSFKLMQPKMKEFKFNFTLTETIVRERTEEIAAETKEDAVKELKKHFCKDTLTNIKEVIVASDEKLEVA